jgi:hypothetical protein
MKRVAIGSLLLLLTPAVLADVLVTVKIGSPVMQGRYNPVKNTEMAIAKELAASLPGYFRHWRYLAAEEATPNDYALNFEIDRDAGNHTFSVVLQARNEIAGTWPAEIWMKAGEVEARGLPESAKAGKRIADAIVKILVAKNQSDIAKRLRDMVPVATAAQWQRIRGRHEEQRLVLPLPWPGSKVHVNSIFRVLCSWPGKTGLAELESQALDTPADYDDSRLRSSYPALTLKPLQRLFEGETKAVRLIAKEVRKLEPRLVYLKIDDPVGLAVAESEGQR